MNAGMFGLNAARQLRQIIVNKISTIADTAFRGRYLFYTNVGISFTLSGAGDVLEQRYEMIWDDMRKWDKTRTKKMALSGITVGIMCHHYYALLDKLLPGRTIKILTKKVLIDQLICSPVCISTFLITIAFLEGITMKEFVEDIRNKGWRLYKADWVVWPPAQVINFYFLPPRFRVLYDSTISLGYDIYTSYVNYDKASQHEESVVEEDSKSCSEDSRS